MTNLYQVFPRFETDQIIFVLCVLSQIQIWRQPIQDQVSTVTTTTLQTPQAVANVVVAIEVSTDPQPPPTPEELADIDSQIDTHSPLPQELPQVIVSPDVHPPRYFTIDEEMQEHVIRKTNKQSNLKI